MTTLSGSSLPFVKGFDDYISAASAHDQDRPGGPSARVEHVSTVGDCRPETFVGDMLRTRLAYGKGDLEIDAYSYVLSHSHEELDPADDELGAVAHGLAREWARDAWPGRQVKIVTQRDNGRWEGTGDDRAWVEGHWHSHIVVANVAEQEVQLRWQDADGNEKTKHYPAGRAVDGDLKNIFRLRHVTDEVVMREWKYDNAAYVEACRRFADGAASKQDLAQRAERGYSTYDQVRLKLRTAASQSTDWDDYTARCQASAVDVRVRGKGGVSYAWVGDDGLERKARARGKDGLGPEFTRAEVEARCAENVAAIERGEALDVPEQELVVPTSTVAPDRPRPQYLTADGRPPWADEQALEAYTAQVRETGGTYEGRAAQALVADEPVEGVELSRDGERATATVDVGNGPLVVDIDADLVARADRVASEWADLALAASEDEGEYVALAQAGQAEAERIVADAWTKAQNETAALVENAQMQADKIFSDAVEQAETIEADARTRAGQIKTQARADVSEIVSTATTQAEGIEGTARTEAARIRAEAQSDAADASESLRRAKAAEKRAKEDARVAAADREAADLFRQQAEAMKAEARSLLSEVKELHRDYSPEAAEASMNADLVDALEELRIPDRDPTRTQALPDGRAQYALVLGPDGKAVPAPAMHVAHKIAAHKGAQRGDTTYNDETAADRKKRLANRLNDGRKDLRDPGVRAATDKSQARDGLEL